MKYQLIDLKNNFTKEYQTLKEIRARIYSENRDKILNIDVFNLIPLDVICVRHSYSVLLQQEEGYVTEEA